MATTATAASACRPRLQRPATTPQSVHSSTGATGPHLHRPDTRFHSHGESGRQCQPDDQPPLVPTSRLTDAGGHDRSHPHEQASQTTFGTRPVGTTRSSAARGFSSSWAEAGAAHDWLGGASASTLSNAVPGGHRACRRSRGPGGDAGNNPCRRQGDQVVAANAPVRGAFARAGRRTELGTEASLGLQRLEKGAMAPRWRRCSGRAHPVTDTGH